MIGVISKPHQLEAIEEFFQLFKTAWEFYRPGEAYSVVIATSGDLSNVNAKLLVVYGAESKSIDSTVGISSVGPAASSTLSSGGKRFPVYCESSVFKSDRGQTCVLSGTGVAGVKISQIAQTVIRLGYDFFDEVAHLLTNAQPLEHAQTPTLDMHISMLRQWILDEGIPLMEVLPVPFGHSFAACLTHDIDFIGIRRHKFDHTMFGFLYRSTIGAARSLVRGKISAKRLLQTWTAVAKLPFVYLGWAKDFWEPFSWYLQAEHDLPATYFLIPFQGNAGEHVSAANASRRASAYDVTDLQDWAPILKGAGCEIGVHGLDAWHSSEKGRAERERVSEVAGQNVAGIRMHWLLQDSRTPEVLEDAGFHYDSTAGYNETVGYRNGTAQVFRPLGARTLLELPMHIQDGALFYPGRQNLSDVEAERRCHPIIEHVTREGGVLTLLWHDRSHAAERFWGDFYLFLIAKLKALKPWFGSAGQVVEWFRQRRDVHFERIETADGVRSHVQYEGPSVEPQFCIRMYSGKRSSSSAPQFVDIAWNGASLDQLEDQLPAEFSRPAAAQPLS